MAFLPTAYIYASATKEPRGGSALMTNNLQSAEVANQQIDSVFASPFAASSQPVLVGAVQGHPI